MEVPGDAWRKWSKYCRKAIMNCNKKRHRQNREISANETSNIITQINFLHKPNPLVIIQNNVPEIHNDIRGVSNLAIRSGWLWKAEHIRHVASSNSIASSWVEWLKYRANSSLSYTSSIEDKKYWFSTQPQIDRLLEACPGVLNVAWKIIKLHAKWRSPSCAHTPYIRSVNTYHAFYQ